VQRERGDSGFFKGYFGDGTRASSHHAATRPRGKWQREDILDSWGASAGESEPSVRLHLHVRRNTFYPNAQVFNFKNPDAKGKPVFKSLHLKDDAAEIASLSAKGWKRSHFPATASGNIYSTEQEKRLDYKWEPVVRRSVNKRAGSFHEPFLVLHAIPRHGVGGRVNYAAV